MIREMLRPARNKAAFAGCFVLVVLLTLISAYTADTRGRQTDIEHTLRVERVRVTKALCAGNRHSRACRQHALNLLRACLESPPCADLLHRALLGLPAGPSRGSPIAAFAPSGATGTNHNSSQANPGSQQNPSNSHPPPTSPGTNHPGHPHQNAPPPSEPAGPPAPSPAPAPTPAPAPLPAEPEKTLPNGTPFPGEGKAKGLGEAVVEIVKGLGESLGHVTGAVAEE